MTIRVMDRGFRLHFVSKTTSMSLSVASPSSPESASASSAKFSESTRSGKEEFA